jgi:hypothetical protein
MRIWPLDLGQGTQQKVELPGNYYWHGAAVDPRGGRAGLATVSGQGLLVVDLATRVARRVLPEESGTFFEQAAFDPTGRRLATVRVRAEDLKEHVIHDVDLESGEVRTWLYRDPSAANPAEAPPLGPSWNGRLLVGGNDGVFRWEPGAPAPTSSMSAPSPAGRTCRPGRRAQPPARRR